MRDWVTHLAGQLTDQPFETLILGKEEGRKVRFAPLARETATKHLNAILARWIEASTRALPLHCEAGFAWIYSFYQSKSSSVTTSVPSATPNRPTQPPWNATQATCEALSRTPNGCSKAVNSKRFCTHSMCLYGKPSRANPPPSKLRASYDGHNN